MKLGPISKAAAPIRVLDVCSGYSASTLAWAGLGFQHVGYSEIEAFPRSILEQRHGAVPVDWDHRHTPDITPLFGDFTQIEAHHVGPVDLLTGGTPCFPASTLIAARRGLVSIAEIEVGDDVLTHEGRWRRVLRVGSKQAPTIILKGQGQSTGIITTADHPFYARRKTRRWVGRENGSYASEMSPPEWERAEQMAGAFWASPTRWPSSEPPVVELMGRESGAIEMTKAMAWVIGRWVGDGWTRINDRRGYVVICCGGHEAEDLAARISSAGLHFSRMQERTTTRFQIAHRGLARWLRREFGGGAADKTIPTWVFGWNHRQALLDGYISADGCRTANGWRITTISDALALGTMLIAQSVGRSVTRKLVTPKRSKCVIEGRTVNERPFWQITIYENARSSIEMGIHRWGLVRSVENGKIEDVFNLEVEGHNSYVADGFVVHNCQAFSIAGLRGGLGDGRGNLTLEFLRLAERVRAEWVAWENVPGVFSSLAHVAPDPRPPEIDLDGGDGPEDGEEVVVDDEYDADESHALCCFLAGLTELGYGWAYRVLDAQYIRVDGCERAVPQRRKRIIVVGHLGDAAGPATVLFERESLRGDPAPRREAGEGASHPVAPCLVSSGGGVERTGDTRGQDAVVGIAFGGNDTRGPIDIATARSAHGGPHGGPHGRLDFESETFVVGALAPGAHPGGYNGQDAYTGHLVPEIAASQTRGAESAGRGGYAGRRQEDDTNLVAHSLRAEGFDASEDGTGRGTPLVAVYGESYVEALRTLREAVGEETFAAWGMGITQRLRAAEILRPEVYGRGIRCAADDRDVVDDNAPPCQEAGACGAVQALWRLAGVGRAPQGWRPSKQLAEQLGATLSALSHARASRDRFVHGLWEAAEGLGILRQALSALQETRRSDDGENQPEHATWQVRRLTPTEAERLMGVPDGFTAIIYRGKPAADGPRYKALGNSQATNWMRWIGHGLADVIRAQREAAGREAA